MSTEFAGKRKVEVSFHSLKDIEGYDLENGKPLVWSTRLHLEIKNDPLPIIKANDFSFAAKTVKEKIDSRYQDFSEMIVLMMVGYSELIIGKE